MDLVNFKVGNKYITLSILDILLTERFASDLTDIPGDDKSFMGVKDYMGTPTPVFNLGIIMNGISTDERNQQLQAKFSQALRDYHEWQHTLEHLLADNKQDALTPLQLQLTFMTWRNGFTTKDDDLNNIVQRIDNYVVQLQKAVGDLLRHIHKPDAESFFTQHNTLLVNIDRLLKTASEHVSQRYKPIIVYTTTDGRSPYIGLLVDSVEDSISIQDEEIKSLSKVAESGYKLDPKTEKMLTGIVKTDDKYSLLLNPTAIFQPDELDLEAS